MRLLGPARLSAVAASVRPLVRPVLIFTIWAMLCVALGAVVGLSAFALPPMGAFGIVGAAAVVLLWVSPDDARLAPSFTLARRLLTIAIVVNLCVPAYYAIAVPGLPWISFRRLALFPLVAVVSLLIATSAEARQRLMDVWRASRPLAACVAGFAAVAFLSIFVSHGPSTSASRFVSLMLEWYLPALAVVLTVRDERDLSRLIRLLSYCALFVAFAGILQFFLRRNFFVTVLPYWALDALAEANPNLTILSDSLGLRNGIFRAVSVYNVALSFGEFAGMMFPFGLHYLACGRSARDRIYGGLLSICLLLAIFVSGSRGAYVMVLAATPVYAALWVTRKVLAKPRSLVPAIAAALALPCAGILVGAIIFWPRAHNLVLGGGKEQYSTQARWEEWHMAIPYILHSPLIGNGFSFGGEVVGYLPPGASFATLDSSVISVLVETGVIGFAFFFGAIVLGIIVAARRFLSDLDGRSEIAAAACAALTGFLLYRLVLSQVENHFTFFVLLAALLSLESFSRDAERRQAPS